MDNNFTKLDVLNIKQLDRFFELLEAEEIEY